MKRVQQLLYRDMLVCNRTDFSPGKRTAHFCRILQLAEFCAGKQHKVQYCGDKSPGACAYTTSKPLQVFDLVKLGARNSCWYLGGDSYQNSGWTAVPRNNQHSAQEVKNEVRLCATTRFIPFQLFRGLPLTYVHEERSQVVRHDEIYSNLLEVCLSHMFMKLQKLPVNDACKQRFSYSQIPREIVSSGN